jgi:hypothetical protein
MKGNLMNIQKDLGLKLLAKLTSDLTWHYHVAKIHQFVGKVSESSSLKPSYYKFEKEDQFMQAYELILNRLTPEEREIIMNDFISKKQPIWWQERYARSTYYRIKHKTLIEFTSFFEQYR